MKPVDLYPFLGVIGVKVKVWQMYGFLLEQQSELGGNINTISQRQIV